MIATDSEKPLPTADDRPSPMQFTLRRVWFWITALCVLLGVPGGYVLLLWIGGWLLVSVAVLGTLLLIQVPVFLLLAGRIRREDR